MRSRFLYTLIFAYFVATFGVTACADDKIEFFKQFLDQSPNPEPRSSNLSQAWLREVVQDAPTRLVNPLTRDARDSSEKPVLFAVRQEVVQPVQPVGPPPSQTPSAPSATQRLVTILPPPPHANQAEQTPVNQPFQRSLEGAADNTDEAAAVLRPLTQMPLPEQSLAQIGRELEAPVQPPVAGPILLEAKRRVPARMAQPVPPNRQIPPMNQPSPPINEPSPPMAHPSQTQGSEPSSGNVVDGADSLELLQAEKRVKQRVDSLQQQLEAEEKQLQSQLALYAKRRDAALEKNDEQSLERLEKAEQTAVANYERRVQRLLSGSLPKEGSNFAPTGEQQAQPEPPAPTRSSPTRTSETVGQPVEKPVAKQRNAVIPPASWLQQKLRSKLSPPQKTPATNPAAATSSVSKQSKFRLVSPEQLRKAKAAQDAAARKAKAAATPSQSSKKRFKLWPFGK